ncbi:unnamed protein product [Fusarium graminearum]|nr:unnamed protein product [Fusarium graminearum]
MSPQSYLVLGPVFDLDLDLALITAAAGVTGNEADLSTLGGGPSFTRKLLDLDLMEGASSSRS